MADSIHHALRRNLAREDLALTTRNQHHSDIPQRTMTDAELAMMYSYQERRRGKVFAT